MDALTVTVITGLPNFAGFVFLALSNSRIINRLFNVLEISDNRLDMLERRIAALEAKTHVIPPEN